MILVLDLVNLLYNIIGREYPFGYFNFLEKLLGKYFQSLSHIGFIVIKILIQDYVQLEDPYY